MASNQQAYEQPMMYGYPSQQPANNYQRKHSEGSAIYGSNQMNQNSNFAFKSGGLSKKQTKRKRVFSTNEGALCFDQKFKQFSSKQSNTKDSSTSSNNKYGSPVNKKMTSGQAQEPKSMYLIKLRQYIKDNEEDNITLQELKDHIAEISLDQIGSRFIQNVYENSSKEEK
jgi:hypothetical protein